MGFVGNAWKKRWVKILLAVLGIAILVFLFRFPVMRGAGRFLIDEDELSKAEVMFVLAGGAEDRGKEAAELVADGWTSQIVCTGEEDAIPVHWPDEWMSMGEFTKFTIVANGVDSNAVRLIDAGSSTWEEKNLIMEDCRKNNWKKIIVLSSRMHTNRVRMVFEKPCREAGIELIIRGARDSRFDENEWWENEDGMIFVTNEFIKTIYYWWNY